MCDQMSNDELLKYFRDSAASIDQVMEEDLADVDDSLLSEVLRYAIFNGGKRIRPQLTVLVGKMVSSSEVKWDDLLKLSLVFEYLHAASLLHDDVIDHSETRRGKPTANVVYGTSPVILAGDFLHARAMTLAGTIGGKKCTPIVGRATEAMVEAEFLQIQAAGNADTSEDTYFRIVAGKTGALIASACEAGAILAGGNEQQCRAARTYGENIGLAFQIVDDLLDYLGDPEKTGKAVGNDLAEGKMTLPLIYALRNAPDNEKAMLGDILAGNPEERSKKIEAVTLVIEGSGGFDYGRESAKNLISLGVSGLDTFDDKPQKDVLKGLAGYVLSRDK